MVERESEWDDEQLGRMLALRLHEDTTACPCGCGLPVKVAHDASQPFITDKTYCHARAYLTAAQRDFEQEQLPPDQRDKRWVAEKKPGMPTRPRPGDGVLWTVAPYQPQPEIPEVHHG